jgi:tRNA threonylcarbamoyladenosine biosynthesis protein TsaB
MSDVIFKVDSDVYLFYNNTVLALILNIETSTRNCSVSLSNNEDILALKEFNDGNYSHSEKLHTFIIDVLKLGKKSFKDIDAIAVSKGPGSYTGLRIGVSAAKGLCYSLDKPLIAVSTLASLSNQIAVDNEAVIIPLLDARRMEVYSAVFDSNHTEIREVKAEIIDINSFKNYLDKKKIYFLGDGVEKCKTLLNHENALFLDNYFPSAKEMPIISNSRFLKKQFEDVAYFEPFYLKDFIATSPKN